MRLARWIAPLGCAGVLAGVLAASAADPVQLRFATVGVGSAWYNYGAGIAELVKPKLPAGSTIDVLPIAGGVGNIKLLQNGEAELGISFQTTSAEGCSGTGAFDKPHDRVQGLAGGLDTYYFGTFVTKASGITSWDELVSRKTRLITAGVGGTGEQTVRRVLDLYGTSKEKIGGQGGWVKAMKRAATASAIADGQADAWAHVVTKGHPVATQLTTVADMRMLSLSDEVVQSLVKKYGFVAATIPPNIFKGQPEPIKTVSLSSNILIRKDVADAVAYATAKALVENAGKLRQIHAALGDFDPKNSPKSEYLGGCPLHPGAARYYKEAGLI